MDKIPFLTSINSQFQLIIYTWKLFKKWCLSVINVFSAIACVGVAIVLVLDFGFNLSDSNVAVFAQIKRYFLLYFFIDLICRLLFQKGRLMYFIVHPMDIFILYIFTYFSPSLSHYFYYSVSQIILLLIMVGRIGHLKHLVAWLKIKPSQLFVIGFLVAIFLGSLLLILPISTVSENGIPFIDALFTAFSAVCVTGLVVNDVGTTFTVFGQTVILLLIQIGGLGIMSFSVLIALIMHRKLSQKASLEIQENYSTFNLSETYKASAFIFKLTLGVEILGAIALFFFLIGDFSEWNQAAFYALFHSVSAFCNAGFSLFPESLISYSGHAPIILIVSALIIVGGMGFPVLFNLAQRYKNPFTPIKVQTKLAIKVTAYLLVFGTLLIYLLEFNHGLQGLSVSHQLLVSFFQSVTSRTAGFNTIALTDFHSVTLVVMMILMVIGASPGSTGGGVKTTTLGVIVLSLIQVFKGGKKIEYSSRRIATISVIRAYSAFFLAISIMVLFFSCLVLFESQPFIALLFETVSAFGTVGVSLVTTPVLSILGKTIIMILMFIGRIGPLTIATAFATPQKELGYEFPKERIGVM